MSKIYMFLLVLAVILSSVSAKCDSLRCGRGTGLVQTGDSKGAVIDSLGEPDREVEGSVVESQDNHKKKEIHNCHQPADLFVLCLRWAGI